MSVTITLDVEDHSPHGADPRLEKATREVFDFLAEEGVRATVFFVGEVACRLPRLVEDAVAAGHEVALHGWVHVPLTRLEPTTFRDHLERGKDAIASAVGVEPTGFRAPTCSLVPSTLWAVDVLAESGFEWSSSVLPASNPLFGWPGAPRRPFRWRSGLVEIPAPVAGVGRLALPILGGVYFRVLPSLVVRAALDRLPSTPVEFLYCHPYDFDVEEPFWVVPEVGRFGSRLLWYGRRRMFEKVRHLVRRRGAAPPLGERVALLDAAELEAFPDATDCERR
ncbi:MAG: hypothetical protein KatS3mg008_0208 [Acidimicrobiales bacterium]|nr:MAG: hypothetical protein KatS3mg008_0208 [Acidimicrobiales bacterium]